MTSGLPRAAIRRRRCERGVRDALKIATHQLRCARPHARRARSRCAAICITAGRGEGGKEGRREKKIATHQLRACNIMHCFLMRLATKARGTRRAEREAPSFPASSARPSVRHGNLSILGNRAMTFSSPTTRVSEFDAPFGSSSASRFSASTRSVGGCGRAAARRVRNSARLRFFFFFFFFFPRVFPQGESRLVYRKLFGTPAPVPSEIRTIRSVFDFTRPNGRDAREDSNRGAIVRYRRVGSKSLSSAA